MISSQNVRDPIIMRKRLAVIKILDCLPAEYIIFVLNDLGLCSSAYDLDHYYIDINYIYKSKNAFKNYTKCIDIDDPLSYIWFRVIVQAMIDAQSGRPCDLNLWFNDMPPGRHKCTEIAHICSADAKSFLKNIDSKSETVVGLRVGTIERYVDKIEKSQLSI